MTLSVNSDEGKGIIRVVVMAMLKFGEKELVLANARKSRDKEFIAMVEELVAEYEEAPDNGRE